MGLYDGLRPLLFRLDAERAHELALKAVASGLVRAPRPAGPTVQAFGIDFPNPVGLAAGFDKDGVAVDQWENLGFGFVELGTVTRHAQPGNPKPRLFRLPEQKGLINRMGFSNHGADALARRLERRRTKLPVGINIGKSKVTELEDAPDDYGYSLTVLRDFGDYFVVNVSSPNTPGLRSLQERVPLTKILWRLKEVEGKKPILVKVSPDLDDAGLDDVVQVALDLELAGIVATNTTISRDCLGIDPQIEGGLSGLPLQRKADDVLAKLRERTEGKLVLIGVGGVVDTLSAQRKLDLGASLVQVYSGWVYAGPGFVSEVCSGLRSRS